MLKTIRRISLATLSAALWPTYLMLASVAARSGPWPREIGRPLGFLFALSGLTLFVWLTLRWMIKWLEIAFELPGDVVRQVRRGQFKLLLASLILLVPEELLARGLIAPGGRPLATPTLCHVLILCFEAVVFFGVARVLRPKGPIGLWLATSPDQLGWVGRRRRALRLMLMAALAGVICLDVRGYGFTARRLEIAGAQSIAIFGACCVVHRLAVAFLSRHSWRWLRRETRLAAKANAESLAPPADLPSRVRDLIDWGVPILGVVVGVFVWDVDLALFSTIADQVVWRFTPETAVTVGDMVVAALCFLATAGGWRYLTTIFTLVVYPRMPEDPGIRFAVLTLTRYFLLAVGVLAGLSALHMGLDKIGVVLAALGVGLGFGLQEIVSNFVSGIILLLERPIRVGDVVTVAAMTGKIDRINIRATTLINSDNQSLIIPNREFITGNLINWTHKDKVIRFSFRVNVALGTDPDRVTDLLLEIARGDCDVLGNPVPSAYLDEFGVSHLNFVLHVYVPDPSYPGKVRHRIATQVQKRFAESGIELALPVQRLRFDSPYGGGSIDVETMRIDQPQTMAGPTRTPTTSNASWRSPS